MPDLSGWLSAAVPGAKRLADVSDVRCLILIGEPGLGKTTAMRAEYERVRAELQHNDRALLIELGFTRRASELEVAIFDSPQFTQWLDGDGRLHLFLDSLDEARLRVEHVAKRLLRGLEGAPVGRLSLRLSCRSADRHLGLEQELQQRFGSESYAVRELAPLTRGDVAAAARSRGLDPDTFVREVIERELQPLAMVPESLRFLLDVAQEHGSVPRSRAEAFEQGLRLLAREPDEDRRDGETKGSLSATGRLAVCARVAAGLTLSGRSAVRTDEGPAGPDEASLTQLAGGREEDRRTGATTKINVSEEILKEALGTAILTAAGGSNRLRFAQASYAEYLTARWLADGGLSVEQRRSLLFSSGDERQRIVPQLHEVATWLAVLSDEFHAELLSDDPAVLLRAEPAGLDAAERERLIDALFVGVRSLEVDRWDRRMRNNFHLLHHPSLASQLRAVIFDVAEEPQVRQVACDIAAACELAQLGGELADLALDPRTDLEVRIAALSAAGTLATTDQRRRFVPLALEEQPDDPDDELKGAALGVVWPGAVGAQELLKSVRAPRRRDLYGLYKAFLLNDLVEGLRPSDLLLALRWATDLPISHYATDPMSSVREQLLVAAWPRLRADAELREGYVGVVTKLLGKSVNLISNSLHEEHPEVFVEQAMRRSLLEGLIDRLQNGSFGLANVLFAKPRLIIADDMDWLLGELRAAVGTEREETLAMLVDRLPILGGSEQALLEARDESPVLRELTAARFEAIRLDSPAAEEARRFCAQRLEAEREDDGDDEEDLDIPGRVGQALNSFDSGDLDGFWIATKWLEINQRRERDYLVSDIRALDGWSVIEETDRERLLRAVPRYLADASPMPERWFGKGTIYWPAWAGYRGMRLLYDLDRDLFEALGPETWERWAPIIVAWHREGTSNTREPEFNSFALERLLATAPIAGTSWFVELLDRELRTNHGLVLLHRLEAVWHPDLEAGMLRRAKRSALDPRKRTELLSFLVGKGSRAALEHARRLVTRGAVAAGGNRRELALRVAVALVSERGAPEWERAWKLMQADEAFGQDLVETMAQAETWVAANLPAKETSRLYEWVEDRFPVEEDPRVEGAHSPSAREQIGMWRNRILGSIAAQGTLEAVDELGRLSHRRPGLIGIRRWKRDAEEILERAEWEPPRPEDLISLSENGRRRYVRSDQDLRNALLGSLERAQAKLGGQRPLAHLLWNSDPQCPKPERLVAAWLEDHLRTDLAERGIFVGRELEIRVNPHGQMGESVDIFVAAIAGEEVEGSPIVQVVVELKCCWHGDIDTAMRDQLVRRYLDDENNQGIYVVAHFDSASWNSSDARRRRVCRTRDLSDSREFFAAQAAEVNGEGLASVSAYVLDCSLDS